MFDLRPPKRRIFSALAALALLVRVAIPSGFMPADTGSNWYLQLCPDNMPAAVMVALFGHDHAHHGAPSENTFFQCDYDGGIVGELASVKNPSLATERAPERRGIPGSDSLCIKDSVCGFLSRAPPTTSA